VSELDRPISSDDLYLARGSDVDASRPIITGDVFEGLRVPGSEDDGALAMVMAHPCSMREGAHLKSHVQMAVVRNGAPIQLDRWDGNYGVMPLPELQRLGDLRPRAVFELAGRVSTAELLHHRRIACLSTKGILLLMQRMAFSMTRVAVSLDVLLGSIDFVLEEVDLLEEWVLERLDPTADNIESALREEERQFDLVMSAEIHGRSLRLHLRDPASRTRVRRSVRAALDTQA
jgi:hypothetical protein